MFIAGWTAEEDCAVGFFGGRDETDLEGLFDGFFLFEKEIFDFGFILDLVKVDF